MSMSTSVTLMRDLKSEKHLKMVAALDALKDAGVKKMPDEMAKYFKTYGGTLDPDSVEEPDQSLEVESVSGYTDNLPGWIESVDEDGTYGFQVDVSKLPEGVRFIQFTNSW